MARTSTKSKNARTPARTTRKTGTPNTGRVLSLRNKRKRGALETPEPRKSLAFTPDTPRTGKEGCDHQCHDKSACGHACCKRTPKEDPKPADSTEDEIDSVTDEETEKTKKEREIADLRRRLELLQQERTEGDIEYRRTEAEVELARVEAEESKARTEAAFGRTYPADVYNRASSNILHDYEGAALKAKLAKTRFESALKGKLIQGVTDVWPFLEVIREAERFSQKGDMQVPFQIVLERMRNFEPLRALADACGKSNPCDHSVWASFVKNATDLMGGYGQNALTVAMKYFKELAMERGERIDAYFSRSEHRRHLYEYVASIVGEPFDMRKYVTSWANGLPDSIRTLVLMVLDDARPDINQAFMKATNCAASEALSARRGRRDVEPMRYAGSGSSSRGRSRSPGRGRNRDRDHERNRSRDHGYMRDRGDRDRMHREYRRNRGSYYNRDSSRGNGQGQARVQMPVSVRGTGGQTSDLTEV